MSELQHEMEAFFAEYTERWNNQADYSSLIEMWDKDQPPFYRGTNPCIAVFSRKADG